MLMAMDDGVDFGPHTALLPVSGLQEEKKRKHHAVLTPSPSLTLPSSALTSPRSTLLTHLSALIPLPPSPITSSSPSTSTSTPIPFPSYLSHTISHYHAYLSSLPLVPPLPPAHLPSLTSQLSTLILLHHLTPHAPTTPLPPLPTLFSSRHATLNLISSSPSLTRSLSALDWLEDLAQSTAVFEADGAVGWKRTLRRMQRGEGGGEGEGVLGVDSEWTGGARWEEGDREEDELLLRYVWTFMRAGKVQEAVQLCVDFKQPWRAASISGGQLWHNEGGEGESVGHRRHFLFRQTCRKLAGHAQVGSYERAIYGLLGSDMRAVLGVSQTWEDCVWAMLRVSADREIDATLSRGLKDDSERQLAQTITAPPLSLAQIFERIAQGDDSIPPSAAQSANSLYHHLQRLLVLAEYEEAEAFITESVRSTPQDTDLIPFAVHLYLYFHPQGPGVPLNDNGRTLFLAYIEHLQQCGLHHLVPLYTAYLSHSDQVLHYSAFLRRLPTVTERIHYLRLAQQYFPATVLRITTVLVQTIIEDERVDEDAPQWDEERLGEGGGEGGGLRGVSAADRERLASLDCFGVSSTSDFSAILEVMRLSNLLFRSFLRRGRLNAAKLLSESLLTSKLNQFIAMEEAEKVSQGEAVDVRREVEAEHAGWVLYMKAINWLAAWSSKLAIKPQPPQPIKASAARTAQQEDSDRKRWKKELAKHDGEVAQWKKGWDEVSTATIDALLGCLQQTGSGWMKRAGQEMEEWRRRLLPSLLFLLHRVCSVSERGVESMQMAELVVDERYRLYEVMDVEERRALMVKLKDSYIHFVLQPQEERRRAINTAPTRGDVQPQRPSSLDAPLAPQSKVEAEFREEEEVMEIPAEEEERQEEAEVADDTLRADDDEMAAADEEDHKYDEDEAQQRVEQPDQQERPPTPPPSAPLPLEERPGMEHVPDTDGTEREEVHDEMKAEQPVEAEKAPAASPPRDVAPQVDSAAQSPLVHAEPPAEPMVLPEPSVEAAPMTEPPSSQESKVETVVTIVTVSQSSPAPPSRPSSPQDEDSVELANPPLTAASTEAEPPALLPRLPSPPVPPSPFQADQAAAPPPSLSSLPSVIEEEADSLPREPRRSSRPRRGPSAARMSAKEEEGEELRPPTREPSIEEEPVSPVSLADSTASSEALERKAGRSTSRRRMSKPVEPSTRVLRTRK